tara:strand:+ start:28865 stop:29368 length:504 start_codon:yes stop_codon:yes gene_type:complete
MNETYGNRENTHSDAVESAEPEIIPFADEADQITLVDDEARAETEEDTTDTQLPAEVQRLSVVDQDLGAGYATPRSSKGRYACPCCGQGATRVMRVRVKEYQQGQPRWVALCAVCAASMLAQVPGTVVGGMVRPSRRKARKAARAADRANARANALRETNAGFRQAS